MGKNKSYDYFKPKYGLDSIIKRVQGYIIMELQTWFDADSSPKVPQPKEGQGSPASLFLHTSFLIC